MKLLKNLVLLFCLSTIFFQSQVHAQAQSSIKSYSFKKGQVFDILLLTNKPNTKENLQDYFKKVFPVATEMGYNNHPGFGIKGAVTQGNYQPQAMVFGHWNDFNGRKKFLQKIEQTMPDFHSKRRDIWSTFNLTYYELKQDLSFDLDINKYNVVTAYWKNDNLSFQKFKKEWNTKAQNAGGVIKLKLKDGNSPMGYYYNPDYFVITEWKDKGAFDTFYQENMKMNHNSVKHVNQFAIK
ncbi:hypothetical protein [Aquimarina sp. AU474]|uniref:hypothetical protein n=1 Tax=Aquimarina sp. AU474 TaxID=2108529 RepID=UPI000D68DD86|nr:hypothetical protein [Aquimarina sp. AU474]